MTETHASKDQLPAERVDDYEWRMTRLGDYYVRFESIPAGFDDARFLKGLPDDACQCEHWGYLFKGSLKFRHTDGHDEVVSAGEAYYAPPGHSFETLENCETVEFSPKGRSTGSWRWSARISRRWGCPRQVVVVRQLC